MWDAYCISGESVFFYGEGVPRAIQCSLENPTPTFYYILARTFRQQKLQAKHDQNVWRETSDYRSFRQNTTNVFCENLPPTEASGKTRPKCLARNFGPQKPQARHSQNVWQEASVYRSLKQNTTNMSGKKHSFTEASGKTRPKCLARSFRLQKLQTKHVPAMRAHEETIGKP